MLLPKVISFFDSFWDPEINREDMIFDYISRVTDARDNEAVKKIHPPVLSFLDVTIRSEQETIEKRYLYVSMSGANMDSEEGKTGHKEIYQAVEEVINGLNQCHATSDSQKVLFVLVPEMSHKFKNSLTQIGQDIDLLEGEKGNTNCAEKKYSKYLIELILASKSGEVKINGADNFILYPYPIEENLPRQSKVLDTKDYQVKYRDSCDQCVKDKPLLFGLLGAIKIGLANKNIETADNNGIDNIGKAKLRISQGAIILKSSKIKTDEKN